MPLDQHINSKQVKKSDIFQMKFHLLGFNPACVQNLNKFNALEMHEKELSFPSNKVPFLREIL